GGAISDPVATGAVSPSRVLALVQRLLNRFFLGSGCCGSTIGAPTSTSTRSRALSMPAGLLVATTGSKAVVKRPPCAGAGVAKLVVATNATDAAATAAARL